MTKLQAPLPLISAYVLEIMQSSMYVVALSPQNLFYFFFSSLMVNQKHYTELRNMIFLKQNKYNVQERNWI